MQLIFITIIMYRIDGEHPLVKRLDEISLKMAEQELEKMKKEVPVT